MAESYSTDVRIGEVEKIAGMILDMPVGMKPPIVGSKINIWKQDPTVEEVGVRPVYVNNTVYPGPSDPQIAVIGPHPVQPDSNGDFLFPPPDTKAVYDIYDTDAAPRESDWLFDASHTYAVVRLTVNMYQQLLGTRLLWQWNNEKNIEPLKIYPHAGFAKNAYYDRTAKALKFFYVFFYDKPPVFACRSFDLVAHETGHAVLDALQPRWLGKDVVSPHAAALHESFCDLTAIFLVLSQFDLIDHIIVRTKADLHYEKNILSIWSEQLNEITGVGGARNADNELKMSDVTPSPHDMSRVFTGAVYDVLADIFTSMRDTRVRDDCEALYLAGKHVAKMVLEAFRNAPAEDPTFSDVALGMRDYALREGRRDQARCIEKHFMYREILGYEFSEEKEPTAGAEATPCFLRAIA